MNFAVIDLLKTFIRHYITACFYYKAIKYYMKKKITLRCCIYIYIYIEKYMYAYYEVIETGHIVKYAKNIFFIVLIVQCHKIFFSEYLHQL